MTDSQAQPRIVTVDGAAGSGKTTLGRKLADALHLPFVDTGLFYRAVMVAAIDAGVDPEDAEELGRLARAITVEINTGNDDSWHVRIDGREAGPELRNPERGPMLGRISQTPQVRDALLKPQRAAAARGAVAAGRDCGTIIFPDANVKFFLEAPAAVRTARRSSQLALTHGDRNQASAEQDVVARDAIDSPSILRADDAYVVDTAKFDVASMVEYALGVCEEHGITQ